VGRLERRVRKLEETVERGGFAAALARASDEDVFLLGDYAQRVQDAQEAGEPIPTLTPDEAAAVQRFEELRAAAVREGWGEDAYRIV
jgi:hypothetical protein